MRQRFAPFWYDRFPDRRRPLFPRHRGPIDTQIVVIGGGLAGCACASAFAAARIPVVVLESGRLGSGATAGAVGLVREDFDVPFGAAASAHGMRAARMLWQGMRRASLDFPATLRRLNITCDLTQQDLLTVAAGRADAGRQLRREYEARRKAGFDHSWLTPARVATDAGLTSGGAIRTHGSVLDPYRACIGLARAAADRGATVFERSEVRRIKPGRRNVEVLTAGGVIRAETVVVAASAGIADLRPLRRHLHSRHGYGVVTDSLPAAVRRQVGNRSAALRDAATPPHFVRWLREDRALIGGADQEPVPARIRDQTLVQRTGQLMYELSLIYPPISGVQPAWSWSYAFDDTADGLPYIGPHRNFPRHLFAMGLGRHGVGAAWLAARILLRHVAGEPAKGDELFGFSRILQGHS
jgi:glycine/D-amino acid oxidase-like deaminating enzyme